MENGMQATDVRVPPSLIISRYRYEKGGKVCHAGVDPATATVRVFSGNPGFSHSLAQHFECTTSNDPHEIATLVDDAMSRVAEVDPRGRGVRTFTFMPTSRCNMGCAYCGQVHVPGNLSPVVSSRFLDRVQSAFLAPDIQHVHVAWFGGEPLLAYRSIVELSVRLVEMARESGRSYSSKMTTNGALLTPQRLRQLINDANVSRFDITLDGPAEVHDRHRPLKAGGASFDTIVETLSWFRDADHQTPAVIVLRTNVDKENLHHVGEYLHIMKKLGFDDAKKFLFEISPIHSWGNDISAIALTTQEAARHEVGWMELMEEIGLPYGLLPGRPAEGTCVATDPFAEVIDNRGNLFSCTETPLTQHAGSDLLGNILTQPTLDRRPRGRFDDWETAVAGGTLPCSSCELRPVCRGACPKQWSEGSVPCPTLKLNFDDRMTIFMRRHGYGVVDAD
jgi:uncharacterized protein